MKAIVFAGIFALSRTLVASDISGTALPDFGDSSGSLISPTQEQELGEAFMQSVRSQARLVSDPAVNQYVERLGERLVSHSDAPGYRFNFFVVDDNSINAFAGPGGYIGVHTGLILAARNESELAGVMAHEIAHVTQRHLLRAYEAANQLSLPTAAAMIAAILLGAATDSDAGIAAASAVQAGSIQYQLNFTRANEKEADRIGIQTLARTEIDPYGMPSFFERLYQSTRLYGAANVPEFLSTHPVTSDRIAESIQRAEQYGHGKRLDSLEFQLIRARLEVLMASDTQRVLREYQSLAKKPSAGPAERYGLALALWRTGKRDDARKILDDLTRTDPDRILYQLTLAELELEAGQTDAALQRFRKTLALYPGDVVVGQYYAAALLQSGNAAKAREHVLEMLRTASARTPQVYQLWAKASSITGPPWETRQASAEVYFLNGNIRLAIDQLEQALQLDQMNRYEQARIQARLEEFKRILTEQERK
jgi:predicted Zn-dependent protease